MYVRVHACSKQCRACNHPRPPLSPANHPPPAAARLVLFLPSLLCHTNPYRYLYVFYSPTTHIAHLTFAVTRSSPSHPREHGIRNAHHHHSSPFTHAILLSLRERLFLFLFPLPSSSNARSNPPGGYGTVSTGTPTRSLKENAIIRRTSTNELIVGASRYRQYWEVLYSTSPGATRL